MMKFVELFLLKVSLKYVKINIIRVTNKKRREFKVYV